MEKRSRAPREDGRNIISARVLSQEVSEAWNVFAPFSQRRKLDWKHWDAIKEISPEETILDGLFEIAIRGGTVDRTDRAACG
jgi:hypothetical protein